jgi:hypothetical protein
MTEALDYVAAHPWVGWLFLGLLSLLVSQKSQIDAWAEKNPRAAGFMKLLRSLGIDPWLLVQSLSLIVRGKLPVKLQAAQIVAAAGTRITPEVLQEVAKQSSPPPPDDDPPTPRDGRPLPPAAIALLFAGSLALNQTACAGEQARPTLAELEKACPSAARVMTIDCPALALRMCPDAPTLDECDARVALEDECDRLIQKELDRCP